MRAGEATDAFPPPEIVLARRSQFRPPHVGGGDYKATHGGTAESFTLGDGRLDGRVKPGHGELRDWVMPERGSAAREDSLACGRSPAGWPGRARPWRERAVFEGGARRV